MPGRCATHRVVQLAATEARPVQHKPLAFAECRCERHRSTPVAVQERMSTRTAKANYQRALQGELTRTILALEEVQDVRVHLALPDQALFRKEGPKAKASVTVSLKGGRSLRPEQVVGIQRLIAASVPEVKTEDVTVLDQHGVVLSRVATDDAGPPLGQLDAKQSLEAHLSHKASRLLDQMFSAGETMVAVDVVLNHEQSKVTTEEVLGAATTDRAGHPAGVITRERSVTKEPTGRHNMMRSCRLGESTNE